jgi:hypothetical protein
LAEVTRGAGFWALLGATATALPPLALLGGCAAEPPSAASSAGPAALTGRLPAVAAGFQRGEARPVGAAGQGREVAYATGGGRFTAAATVEFLAEDTAAAAALETMLDEVLRAVLPREMRDAGRLTLAAGGVSPLLCAETVGRYGRERVAGLLCAGRVGGTLLRIRVTMPAREPPPADPRAFAEAVAAALSGPGAAAASAPSG